VIMGGSVLWLGRRTCDREVASSTSTVGKSSTLLRARVSRVRAGRVLLCQVAGNCIFRGLAPTPFRDKTIALISNVNKILC